MTACAPPSPAPVVPPALSRVDADTPVPMGPWEVVLSRGELYRDLAGRGTYEQTEHGLWVVAYITVWNQGLAPATLKRSDFELVDRAGTRYRPSERPAALAFALHEGLQPLTAPVPSGGQINTVLVFEAPVDINLPQLVISPGNVAIYLQ